MIRMFTIVVVTLMGACAIAQEISHVYGQLCNHLVSLVSR